MSNAFSSPLSDHYNHPNTTALAILTKEIQQVELSFVPQFEQAKKKTKTSVRDKSKSVGFVRSSIDGRPISSIDSHFERKEVEKTGDVKISQDIIQGKANNLIILLHGVPGVGKTATAEAVADVNNKPLFPITCGDLGLEPDKVEVKLSEIFQLANRWNCVLLLDEADAFLAARRIEDLKRNALVSVFLRILILTTNRVGTIDEAFQSRIHAMLYYPPLTYDQTREIFKMNINRLNKIDNQRKSTTRQPAIEIDEERILDFAEDHFKRDKTERWNGRQIRNAFQIASSMAWYDWSRQNHGSDSEVPPTLDDRHFERVASATQQFRLYLREARGKDDWELV
ncbi:P-loop containing nucleoside triphosphate hydrolase protein [Biscogniauxia marginata]|nr:P-loop containing nucleoside triphosphate hydrolase protein [Biscogniauxia marginata]